MAKAPDSITLRLDVVFTCTLPLCTGQGVLEGRHDVHVTCGDTHIVRTRPERVFCHQDEDGIHIHIVLTPEEEARYGRMMEEQRPGSMRGYK